VVDVELVVIIMKIVIYIGMSIWLCCIVSCVSALRLVNCIMWVFVF